MHDTFSGRGDLLPWRVSDILSKGVVGQEIAIRVCNIHLFD